MPKHRSSVYTVVRERRAGSEDYDWDGYAFSTIVGTYLTHQRADEVAAASLQAMKDAGMQGDDYKFSVQISTWYEE